MSSVSKKLFFLVSILIFPKLVFGANIITGQWTTPAKVLSVGIYGASFRVETETTDVTSSGCSGVSSGAYWWWATDPASKETYSLLLTAYTAGKKITVTYTDECNNAAKRLQYIIIRDN